MTSLHPSDKNNQTHGKAIKYIANYIGREKDFVESIINGFFGKWGLKYFIERKRKINIRELGTFYFHGQTLNAERRRKEAVRELHRYNDKMSKRRCRNKLSSSKINSKK